MYSTRGCQGPRRDVGSRLSLGQPGPAQRVFQYAYIRPAARDHCRHGDPIGPLCRPEDPYTSAARIAARRRVGDIAQLSRKGSNHSYAVQQHQSLARRHPSRGQRQAPSTLPSGMVLSVQSPQPARRFGRLSHPACRRVRHHHLRSAQGWRQARRRRSPTAPPRISCTTCFNRIGIKHLI
jgi:hypothetical protein